MLTRAVDAFFIARRPRKDSPHTVKAYAGDLRAVGELLARAANTPLEQLTVDDVTVSRLRSAFAEYAEGHAKASINRCWSTWNQLFTFLVAERHRDGNPMPAVAKAKLPRRLPKPLAGEDTPEQLLQAAAAGRRRARNPWPDRDLAVLATLLLTGLRSAELLDLRVDSLAGRPGERRLHVTGKGGRARSVPVEPPLEAVLDAYLASRRTRFPHAPRPTGRPVRRHPWPAAATRRPAVPGRHHAALGRAQRPARPRRPGARAAAHLRHPAGRGRRHRHRDHEPARPRLADHEHEPGLH
jgi:integrase/recombinase XerC